MLRLVIQSASKPILNNKPLTVKLISEKVMTQDRWNTIHRVLLSMLIWSTMFTAGVWVGKSYLPSINDWECTRHTTVLTTDPESGQKELLMVCIERKYNKPIEGEIK